MHDQKKKKKTYANKNMRSNNEKCAKRKLR